ncbi:MAG: LuxR C-terminal-related transcriptional regulator [Terrimesophilobacter sp.]
MGVRRVVGTPLVGAPPLPRYLVRNIPAEDRLGAFTRDYPLTLLRAPVGLGKRTLVASWLRHGATDLRPLWLRLPHDTAQASDVIDLVNHTLDSRAPLLPMLSDHYRWRERDRPTVIVVDIRALNLTADQLEEIEHATRVQHRLPMVVIQDTLSGSALAHDRRHPVITAYDLQLAPTALRDTLERHHVQVPESIVTALCDNYRASPVMVSALVEQLTEHDRRPEESLAWAHATSLTRLARRLMPHEDSAALALLTMLPTIDENRLVEKLGHEYSALPFRELATRGYLERVVLDDNRAVVRLPDFVREIVRSVMLPYYLDDRTRLHLIASSLSLNDNDLLAAVQQLLLLNDVAAAVDLCCAHWEASLRRSLDKTREVCASIPEDGIRSSLEASAAVVLIHLATPRIDPPGTLTARVLAAQAGELAALKPHARLTVSTARINLLLERGCIDTAEREVHDTHVSLGLGNSRPDLAVDRMYRDFLLAAGRTALFRGRLRTSARLYDEALSIAQITSAPRSTYQALIGKALCLSLNAEFLAAQELLDHATAIEEQFAWGRSQASAEKTWCQCLIWDFQGGHARIQKTLAAATSAHPANAAWGAVIAYMQASLFRHDGRHAEAESLLRTHLESIIPTPPMPLFRHTAAAFLAVCLLDSRQPGAALEALNHRAPHEIEPQFLPAIEALAHISRGQPLAALEATETGLNNRAAQPKTALLFIYLARAVALETLGFHDAAEDAFLNMLGIATNSGMQLTIGNPAASTLTVIRRRAQVKEPRLNADAIHLGTEPTPIVGSGAGTLTKLTKKEREVLRHLIGNVTLGQIAAKLYISENTVKTHTRNLYHKLGVSSRHDAAEIAIRWGISS